MESCDGLESMKNGEKMFQNIHGILTADAEIVRKNQGWFFWLRHCVSNMGVLCNFINVIYDICLVLTVTFLGWLLLVGG